MQGTKKKGNDHHSVAQCVHCNNFGRVQFVTLDHDRGTVCHRRVFWVYKCDSCKQEFVEVDLKEQLTRSGRAPCPTYWKNGAPILYNKTWLERRTKNYKKVKMVVFV